MSGKWNELILNSICIVHRAGCSAVHKTRSIAATALVPLVPPNQLVHTLHHLIDMLLGAANHPPPHPNAIHGILMQVSNCWITETSFPLICFYPTQSLILPVIKWLVKSGHVRFIYGDYPTFFHQIACNSFLGLSINYGMHSSACRGWCAYTVCGLIHA